MTMSLSTARPMTIDALGLRGRRLGTAFAHDNLGASWILVVGNPADTSAARATGGDGNDSKS